MSLSMDKNLNKIRSLMNTTDLASSVDDVLNLTEVVSNTKNLEMNNHTDKRLDYQSKKTKITDIQLIEQEVFESVMQEISDELRLIVKDEVNKKLQEFFANREKQ